MGSTLGFISSSTLSSVLGIPSNDHEITPPIFITTYATIAIKPHAAVTLVLMNSNFNQWFPFFLSLCGKFGLHLHIDGMTDDHLDYPKWAIANAYIHC